MVFIQLGLRFHKWPHEAEQDLELPEVFEILAAFKRMEPQSLAPTPTESWKAT